LFVAEDWTDKAWEGILKRKPRCVEWREPEIRALVPEENVERTLETVQKSAPLNSGATKSAATACDTACWWWKTAPWP